MKNVGREWSGGKGRNRISLPESVQYVENPLAENLGYGRLCEHGEEVAPAKGEDADSDGQIDRVEDFNNLRHIIRELVSVAFVDAPNRIFVLVAKRTGKLRRAEP